MGTVRESRLCRVPARRVGAFGRVSLVLPNGERYRPRQPRGWLNVTDHKLVFAYGSGDADELPWEHVRSVHLQRSGRRAYLVVAGWNWSGWRLRIRASAADRVAAALDGLLGGPGRSDWGNPGFLEPPAREAANG